MLRILTGTKLHQIAHESYLKGLEVGFSLYKRQKGCLPKGTIISSKVEQEVTKILEREGF